MTLYPINGFESAKLKANDYKKLYCVPDLYAFLLPIGIGMHMKSENLEHWNSYKGLVFSAARDMNNSMDLKQTDVFHGEAYEQDVYEAYTYVKECVGWYTTDTKLYDKIVERGFSIGNSYPDGELLVNMYKSRLRQLREKRYGRRRYGEVEHFNQY